MTINPLADSIDYMIRVAHYEIGRIAAAHPEYLIVMGIALTVLHMIIRSIRGKV